MEDRKKEAYICSYLPSRANILHIFEFALWEVRDTRDMRDTTVKSEQNRQKCMHAKILKKHFILKVSWFVNEVVLIVFECSCRCNINTFIQSTASQMNTQRKSFPPALYINPPSQFCVSNTINSRREILILSFDSCLPDFYYLFYYNAFKTACEWFPCVYKHLIKVL